MSNVALPSIRDAEPLEVGGSVARSGFEYQDHVAALYCLRLLESSNSLSEVWCETQDDITLLQIEESTEIAEYVQVKKIELNQLWSVAELGKKESVADKESKKKQGKNSNSAKPPMSILQKSLQQDRCAEKSRFRMVTSRDVNKDLKPLKFSFGAPGRDPQKVKELIESLSGALNGFSSPKGNGAEFWVNGCTWEVYENDETLENKNLLTLERILHNKGVSLAPDQRRQLYLRILRAVQNAGRLKWEENPDAKKFLRREFSDWVASVVYEIQHPEADPTGAPLKRKMREALLPPETVEAATELRALFRRDVLSPSYLDIGTRDKVIGEVVATLNSLLSKLDAGELDDDGVSFHYRCIELLEGVKQTLGLEAKLPTSYLQGCMYDITNRCLHRFRRI